MPPVRRVKKSKTRKTGEHVPRPPNSFMLFRSWGSQNLPDDIEDRPNRNSALSIYLGARWREMDDNEREIWETKAREAKDAHERRYPDYKYQPTR
ncbi:HMG-box, partial [Agrocybe pediades]